MNIRDSDFNGYGRGGPLTFTAEGRGAMAFVDVVRSKIHGSHADGVFADSSGGGTLSLNIENSFLSSNTRSGIAIGLGSGNEVTLLNNTIAWNGLFGVYAKGGFVEVTNSIVWSNDVGWDGPGDGIDIFVDRFTVPVVELRHSDVGYVDGTYDDLGGNVRVSPGFIGRTDLQGGGGWWYDRHLRTDSPLIDRGLCYELGSGVRVAPLDDFDGEVRPMGAGCEIGADEVDARR